jgi:hypothetical protein
MGFVGDNASCAAINLDEINQRRGDLPMSLQVDSTGDVETGEVPINQDTLSSLMEVLNKLFSPTTPPTLSLTPADCPDAHRGSPAAYCPATNTITADLAALQKLGKPEDESDYVLVQGDDTALLRLCCRAATTWWTATAVQGRRSRPGDRPHHAQRAASPDNVDGRGKRGR